MDPVTVGLIAAGVGRLMSGLFGARSAANQRRAAVKTGRIQDKARGATFANEENTRRARLDAMRSLLRNAQGSLGPGAPNYDIPDDTFNALREKRYPDVSPTPRPPNPGTSGVLAGLFGNVGNIGERYAVGQSMENARPGVSGGVPEGVVNTGQDAEALRLSRMCAIFPNYPGCPAQAPQTPAPPLGV